MSKLIGLKNKCPEIFNKEQDAQIRDMIDYAKEFQTSDRYKELRRLELKEKLSVVTNIDK
jgi:hypothetical protein